MAGHSDIKAAAFPPPDYLDSIFNLRCDDGISALLSEGNSMFFTEGKTSWQYTTHQTKIFHMSFIN